MSDVVINIRFAAESLKKKYMRKGAKKHSWRSKFYAVLKIESYSARGPGFVVICNDAGELWWVSNQDVRVINIDELVSN